jgi:hypothetical protein
MVLIPLRTIKIGKNAPESIERHKFEVVCKIGESCPLKWGPGRMESPAVVQEAEPPAENRKAGDFSPAFFDRDVRHEIFS